MIHESGITEGYKLLPGANMAGQPIKQLANQRKMSKGHPGMSQE